MSDFWWHFVGRDSTSLRGAGIQSAELEGHDFICRFQGVPRNVYHHFDSGRLIWSADYAENIQGSHTYRCYTLEDDLFLLDFRKNPNGVPERNLFFLQLQARAGLLVCIRQSPKSARIKLILQRASLAEIFTSEALTAFPPTEKLAGRTITSAFDDSSHIDFRSDGKLVCNVPVARDMKKVTAEYLAFACSDRTSVAAFCQRNAAAAGVFICSQDFRTAVGLVDVQSDRKWKSGANGVGWPPPFSG
ncbi:MoaF N-terminal domain-containing protein [Ensifer sp. B1-9]|uniref:MoaF N-terminal domain-containing protein n=1 Tax=Ensifer sp. B1-9 TaxID=3141455 RepID=UPI003D25AD66